MSLVMKPSRPEQAGLICHVGSLAEVVILYAMSTTTRDSYVAHPVLGKATASNVNAANPLRRRSTEADSGFGHRSRDAEAGKRAGGGDAGAVGQVDVGGCLDHSEVGSGTDDDLADVGPPQRSRGADSCGVQGLGRGQAHLP